jgi:hypothetical protein
MEVWTWGACAGAGQDRQGQGELKGFEVGNHSTRGTPKKQKLDPDRFWFASDDRGIGRTMDRGNYLSHLGFTVGSENIC